MSCEETFIPTTNVEDEKYVVESYLELNDQAIFPYLISKYHPKPWRISPS